MKTKTTNLHIRLTPEERELFQKIADDKGITVTKLLIDLVRKEKKVMENKEANK